MESPDRSQPWVLARLVAVSSTMLALAAGAHVAGGGALPSGAGLALLVSLTVGLSAVLAQRRLRLVSLLPVAAAWQWLLHEGFSLGSSASSGSVAALSTGHAGHAGSAGPWADVSRAVTSQAPHLHAASTSMLVAHAVATVTTVVLLAATEKSARRAFERWSWAVPVLVADAGPVAPATHRVATGVVTPPVRLRSVWVLGAVGSRGPPALRVAV